jgi:hypothetical protein
VLVQDNLNIHSKASLYEAFPPAEARRASPAVLGHPAEGQQRLCSRDGRRAALEGPVRHPRHTKSNWHFTTKDARIKLKQLYPSI